MKSLPLLLVLVLSSVAYASTHKSPAVERATANVTSAKTSLTNARHALSEAKKADRVQRTAAKKARRAAAKAAAKKVMDSPIEASSE